MTKRRYIIWLIYWKCLLALSSAQAQWPEYEPRPADPTIPAFRATWTSGERSLEQLAGWDKSSPALELRSGPLEQPLKAVHQLRSTRVRSKPATASGVYFVGDDFLPGVVLGLAPASVRAASIAEPLLTVQAEATATASDAVPSQTIDVRGSWIKKIVWQPRGIDDFQPGTAFFRNGHSRRFRGLRWSADAVRLLEDDKVESTPLSELAELHLAEQHPWTVYLRLLADLSPDCRTKIVQFESAARLRVTTSSARLRPWLSGNQTSDKYAMCVVQPAWARDGLWVPLADLQQLVFFAPHEAPLTRFEPVRHTYRGFAFAGGESWRRNASVLGTPLFSGGRDYAWGLGVQAAEELEFTLPSMASSLRTWVGIDGRAGKRGAARGRIEAGDDRRSSASSLTSVESGSLIGSERSAERLEIALPRLRAAQTTVRLIADPLVSNRPERADPLDIGDFVDWLEPVVVLDQQQLAKAVQDHWETSIWPLAGWSLDGDWKPQSLWRPGERPRPGFRRQIVLFGEQLRMTQAIPIETQRNQLVIRASQLAGKLAPIELRLLVDGRQQVTRNVPIDEQRDDAVAMVVDLSAFAGRTTRIDLEFRSRGHESAFEIQSVDLEAAHP